MVGFILMKVSSCSQSVRPPKTSTTTPVTSGITATRLRISQVSTQRHHHRAHEPGGGGEDVGARR